jgi:3-phenylpropionate/trans-cinnamate dioxygenase ferredoxin reductase subunit
MPLYGRSVRLESVPNALEQARQAAAAICATAEPKSETPWFWSDQYDLKLQIAGMPFDVDQIVVRGDPAARKFAVFHLSQNRVQAVEAINAPPEFIVGRQWLASRREIDLVRLADVSIPMKEV